MPGDRTLVTEIGTALGTLDLASIEDAVRARPDEVQLPGRAWEDLDLVIASRRFAQDAVAAFANGVAFRRATDGLRGRRPRIIEWTGGRRPPGDEVAPIDLRIDHVFLISCKYLSANITNTSPARVFDGLLAMRRTWATTDWYELVAGDEYQALYDACVDAVRLVDLPAAPADLTSRERRSLRDALRARAYPMSARAAYGALCDRVSAASAERWRHALEAIEPELMLWRLLRIGSAPYFVLGAHRGGAMRLRVANPWDWRDQFDLLDFEVRAAVAGQPRVDWRAHCEDRRSHRSHFVEGHVEIRWSHGRFSQPPEAKIYLDTPHSEVPGYFPLE
jgi:hypothetical protein